MKKLVSISFGLLLFLFLTACGNQSVTSEVIEDGKKLKEVSIMLDWYPNAVHSYLYVAQEKGYFEEEGVKLDIQFPANTTDPLTLTAAGKVTLGLYYQPDVIMARANENIPVKSVAGIVQSPMNYTVFPADSSIQSPKDLEGKRVGYPGIPLNEALLETIVTHEGGDISKVEMIDVGFELNSSLVTENVDAVIGAFINHEVPVLHHKGFETRHFNPVEYGVPAYSEIVLITSDETWKKEKETIQAFWRAAQKGYQFMKGNPDEALTILLNNQDEANFPLEEVVERESMEILLPKMEEGGVEFGTQNEETWTEVSHWLKKVGLIEEIPEVSDMVVNIEE